MILLNRYVKIGFFLFPFEDVEEIKLAENHLKKKKKDSVGNKCNTIVIKLIPILN